jgi:hypothetical protein
MNSRAIAIGECCEDDGAHQKDPERHHIKLGRFCLGHAHAAASLKCIGKAEAATKAY